MKSILFKVVVVLMIKIQNLGGLDNSKSISKDFEKYSNADNCTCQPTNLNRYSRQSQDPLEITIDRMQIIGRLTNAIYLQQGLLDKSILPYDVIAELLFFGDVKQDALNDPGIGKVFEEIKTLPETLKTSDRSILEAETTYQTLFNMRKLIDGVETIDQWKQKDTLFADLNDFKAKGYDLTVLNELSKLMSDLGTYIGDIKDKAKNKEEAQTKPFFDVATKKIDDVIKKTLELSNKLPNMAQMLSGQNATSSLSDIHKLSTAVRQFAEAKSQMGSNPNGRTNLNQKMDLVSGLAKKTAEILPFLESIKMIMESRKVADRRRGLTLTNGFPNGFTDLATLPVLVLNPWLEKLSGIHVLPKVFPPLEAFIATFKEVSDDLTPLRDPNSQSINNLHSFLKDVISSGSFPSDAKTVTDTVYQCYEEALTTKSEPLDLTSSQETLEKIDLQMAQMAQILDFFKSDKVSKMLKDVKEIASKAKTDDVTVLKKAVEELSALDTKIGFDDVFKQFSDLFSNAVSFAKTPVDPESVTKKFSEIDTFISGDLVSFQNIFTKLQKVNLGDAEKANQILEKSKKLRNPIPDPVKQEMTQVIKMAGTLLKLKSVGDVIDVMIASQNDESKALAALDTPSKHSETLGSATRGIVNFRDVITEKPVFATIQTHLQLVGDKMEPALSKFQTMSDALDAWKTTVTLPDSQKLEDFSKIFLDAKSISGIGDVKKIRDDVEKLQKSATDPAKQKSLGELKKALDELNSIGLDFVRYQQSFGNSEDSLKALDLFFAKWRGLLNPSPVAQLAVTNALNFGSSTPAGVVRDVTAEATTSAAVLLGMGWLELIGIVLAIIFVVVATVLTCKYRKKLPCCKEKKKKKKPIVDNDDGKKASTSGSTSTVASDSGENLGDKKAKLSKMEKGTTGMKKEGKDEKKDPDGGKKAALNVQVQDETKVEKKKEEKKDKKENPVPPPPPPPAKVERKEPPPVVSKPPPPLQKRVAPLQPAGIQKLLVFIPNCYRRVLLDVTKHLFNTQKNVNGILIFELYETALYDFAADVSKRAEIDAADWRKTQKANDQDRGPYQANPRTSIIIHKDVFNRCFYKDNYFNGNCHFMPNGQMYFITQAPIIAPNGRTDDKFFYFISQTKCGVIIFFKSTTDATDASYGGYFPKEPTEHVLLSEENQTPFTVTCLKKEVVIEGILIKRELLIEYSSVPAPPTTETPPAQEAPPDSLAPPAQLALEAPPAPPAMAEQSRETAGNEEQLEMHILKDEQPGPSSRIQAGGDDDALNSDACAKYKADGERDYAHEGFDPNKIHHKMIHYEYIGWEEEVPPKNLNAIQHLLNLIQDQPSVCVHSKEGLNRAGAFTCLEVARQNLCIKLSRNPNDANISFEGVLREVRATRKNAVTTVAHFGLVVKAIVDMAKAENTDKAVEEKMASTYAKFSNSYVYCSKMTSKHMADMEEARIKAEADKKKKDESEAKKRQKEN